jgi:TM2 domain-containing membrane protein YozV
MTQPPEPENTDDEPGRTPPGGSDRPHGDPLLGRQPGYGYDFNQGSSPQYGQQYGQQAYQQYAAAPYGIHPGTGLPYSDKSKIVAGLLQVLLPLGIGRMYMGQTGLGVAQLLVTLLTCGVGAVWPFIDGILILVGDKTDAEGRILRS